MLDTPQVNTLTADPLLRLLLALEGRAPDSPDAATAWKVWLRFLSLPASGESDASFQVVWVDGVAPRLCQVHLTRQLTDNAAGNGPYTVQVVMQFDFEMPERAESEEVELWESDFPGDKEFLAAITLTRGFRLLMGETPVTTLVYQEELDTDEEYYPEAAEP